MPNIYKSVQFLGILKKPCIGIKGVERARFALISGNDDFSSYPNTNGAAGHNAFVDEPPQEELPTVQINPDSISFGTLAAEITSTTSNFFPQEDEYDLDWPTEGFNSIPEAIEDIRKGKVRV